MTSLWRQVEIKRGGDKDKEKRTKGRTKEEQRKRKRTKGGYISTNNILQGQVSVYTSSVSLLLFQGALRIP